jgi:type III secretory pathway component EscS
MMYELQNQTLPTYAKLIVIMRLAAPVPPGLQNAILAVCRAYQ